MVGQRSLGWALLFLVCFHGVLTFAAEIEVEANRVDTSIVTRRLEKHHALARRLQGKLQTQHHARLQKTAVQVKGFVQEIVRPFMDLILRLVDRFKAQFTALMGSADAVKNKIRAFTSGWGANLQTAMNRVRSNPLFNNLANNLRTLMNQVKSAAESNLETGVAALGAAWTATWDRITSIFRFQQRDIAMALANDAARRARGEKAPAFVEDAHHQLHEALHSIRILGGKHGEKLIDPIYQEAGKMLDASFAELDSEMHRRRQGGVLETVFGRERATGISNAVRDLWSRTQNPIPELYTVGISGQLSVGMAALEMMFDTHKHQLQVWGVVGLLLGTSIGSGSINMYKGIGFKGPGNSQVVRSQSVKQACAGWAMGVQGGVSIPVTGLGPLQVSLGGAVAVPAQGPSLASLTVPSAKPSGNILQRIVNAFSVTPTRGCSFATLSAGGSAGLGKGAVPMAPSVGGDAFVTYYFDTPAFFDCASLRWRRPSFCSAIMMLMIPGVLTPPYVDLIAGYTIILGNTGMVQRFIR